MKKIKVLVATLITMAFLVACGANTSKVNCVNEGEMAEIFKVNYELTVKDEALVGIKQSTGFPKEMFGETEGADLEEMMKESFKASGIEENEGLKIIFDHKDEKFEWVSLNFSDLSKVGSEQFSQIVGFGNTEEALKISNVIKFFEDSGLVCEQ